MSGDIYALLLAVQDGTLSIESAKEKLASFAGLADGSGNERIPGLATLDHDRERRTGTPEVVYGESKTAEDIATILRRFVARGNGAMATRVSATKWSSVRQTIPEATYFESSQIVVVPKANVERIGTVAVVSAGTSDGPVAEEVSVVLDFLGAKVASFIDVGVAGISRLFEVVGDIALADVVVAIAGMEGALPSVLSGLVKVPVIAVPTSVGYGVGHGGFVAMQSMLATCSPGITVVNIDNGFGAAVAAVRVLQSAARNKQSKAKSL